MVSASVGVATSDGATTAVDLVRDAVFAISRAKALGKRRVELCVDEMRLSTQRRTHLGVEAHDRPIVALGLVQPLDFNPLAEATGAIVDLGA